MSTEYISDTMTIKRKDLIYLCVYVVYFLCRLLIYLTVHVSLYTSFTYVSLVVLEGSGNQPTRTILSRNSRR